MPGPAASLPIPLPRRRPPPRPADLHHGDEDVRHRYRRRQRGRQPGGTPAPQRSARAAGDTAGGDNRPVDNNMLSNSSNPPNPQLGNTGYNGPVMVLPDGSIVPATTNVSRGPRHWQFSLVGFTWHGGRTGFLRRAFTERCSHPAKCPEWPEYAACALATAAAQWCGQSDQPDSDVAQAWRNERFGGDTRRPWFSQCAGHFPHRNSFRGGTMAPAGQQVIGAGLAGVASKREQEGIKTYNQRTKYNEWSSYTTSPKIPRRTVDAGSSRTQRGQD